MCRHRLDGYRVDVRLNRHKLGDAVIKFDPQKHLLRMIVLTIMVLAVESAYAGSATGNKYMVATVQPLAADAKGNWVAITATVNTAFGSKVVVPGTGVILNNEMDDFSIQPGVSNACGLVGEENNAIAPGKRPLSSMSPTIVLNSESEPVLTVGAAGGLQIITQVVSTIVNYLELRMDLADAVAPPRYHHQWLPNVVQVESTVPTTVLEALRRGHGIEISKNVGVTQAIARDSDGTLMGVYDPRVQGKAAGN